MAALPSSRSLLTEAWAVVRAESASITHALAWFVLAGSLVSTVLHAALFTLLIPVPIGTIQNAELLATHAQGAQDVSLATYLLLQTALACVSLVISIFYTLSLNQIVQLKLYSVRVRLGMTLLAFIPALISSLLYAIALLGGLILFIFPALLFSLWYFFYFMAVVIDGRRGFGALRLSHELVRGRFWAVARPVGAIGVSALLLTLASLLVTLVALRIIAALTSATIQNPGDIALAPLLFLGGFTFAVLNGAAQVYPSLACVLLYDHLKKTAGSTVPADQENS